MTTVSINTEVPDPDSPGCPYLVFFGNGDWEFCTAHDVEFLDDYMGAVPVVDVLNTIAVECLDEEEMDEFDGQSLFVQEFKVDDTNDDKETVITLHYTGEVGVAIKSYAYRMTAEPRSSIFNFVAIPEFFDDLKYWIKHNRKRMDEVETEHPRDLTDLME